MMITSDQLAAHAAWIAAGLPAGDPRQIVLRGATLRGADLRGATLRGADLRDADLRGANLCLAILRGANLVEANLVEASLDRASLDGASLDGATLRGADLRDADLRGASLDGARLGGAILDGANLRGANLRGARGITSAGPVGHKRRIIYAVDHGDRVMVQAGCRWDTAGSVIAAIEADYANAPAMRDAYVATVRAMVATLEAQR